MIGDAFGFLAIDGNIGTIDIGGDLIIGEIAFAFIVDGGNIDDITIDGNFEIKGKDKMVKSFGFKTKDGNIGNVNVGG